MTLKTQIKERLDVEREAIRRFQENDGRCFFICTPTDEDFEKGANHYFAALEAAIAYGKEESCGIFCIEKEIFEDRCADDDSDEAYAVNDCAWYTKNGEMIHCARFPYLFGIIGDVDEGGSSRFEDAYIPLQNPFEAGDIVRIAGDLRPAIVQESREQWCSLLERNIREPHTFHPTYDDNCLRVEFLGEDGEMFHDHPYLLSLEKLNNGRMNLNGNSCRQRAG